ncbi:DUF2470 domain-containing protein [Microbacterium koreense]|uniref:DUF2470 domain-containing protein n=1 Tax=Microbacterium koreense TaxID=323761 RepID=A0ABW2ZP22_9MICO
MIHRFDDAAHSAVLAHMNGDHADDNLLIARAFGPQESPVASTMVRFDGVGGDWESRDAKGDCVEFRVEWPGGPIDERPHVRREIVALYDAACVRLGATPRPHA